MSRRVVSSFIAKTIFKLRKAMRNGREDAKDVASPTAKGVYVTQILQFTQILRLRRLDST